MEEWSQIRDEHGRGILEAYYADPPSMSFAMQVTALFTRYTMLHKALRDNDVVVIERSIAADNYVFKVAAMENKTMSHIQGAIYDRMYAFFNQQLPQHVLIYIDTPPAVCLTRIRDRARPGEATITPRCLDALHVGHQRLLDACGTIHYRLDGTATAERVYLDAVPIIERYLSGVSLQ